MTQKTCFKTIIFHNNQNKNINFKRTYSEIDDLEPQDFVQKKLKIDDNPDDFHKKCEVQQEKCNENDENLNKLTYFEKEIQNILAKFKGKLMRYFESGELHFFKLR